MSAYVELEIQELLNQGEPLDNVADRLLQNIESNPDNFTLDNINGLARFLVQAKKEKLLIDFVLRHLENEEFPIPWAFFLEAIATLDQELEEKALKALSEGIEETQGEANAGRSLALQELMPVLREWSSNRRYKVHKEYASNKRLLLEQLITLRTQQLYEQEKSLLQRLQKLYPGDTEIKKEANEHKQRFALEILSRRSPKARALKIEDYSPADPEVDQALEALVGSLLEQAEEYPDMAFDFAIVAYMLEAYEAALDILEFNTDDSESILWFRLEAQLKARRFVELLTDLAKMEIALSHKSETFFATAYLRAQALWGLGQKHTAIEVMEGLMASRPHYRAAGALLSIWSGQ